MRYLACYCACLGDLKAAKVWLEKAFAAAKNKEEAGRIKLRAQEDPDLKPLWKNIGEV